MARSIRWRALAALLALALSAPMAARALSGPVATSEIHIFHEEGESWPNALMRFPLKAVHEDFPGALEPFFDGAPPRFDFHAYADDFDGFASAVMGEFRFETGGAALRPELGALELIDTRNAVGPHSGLIATRALLDICAEPPDAAALEAIQIVLQVMLFDAAHDAALEIHIPAGAGATRVVDHRMGAAEVRPVVGPAVTRTRKARRWFGR